MRNWIKRSLVFILESVFLWPEREANKLFDFISPDPAQWHYDDDDDEVEVLSSNSQTKETKEYNFMKQSYEDLFRKKMKGKEGKLVRLIKGKTWTEYKDLITESNAWIFNSTNNNLVSFNRGSNKVIGFANADINLIKPNTILLYLGLTKIVNKETCVDLTMPCWLLGEKKLWGWIFVDHFIIIDGSKK